MPTSFLMTSSTGSSVPVPFSSIEQGWTRQVVAIWLGGRASHHESTKLSLSSRHVARPYMVLLQGFPGSNQQLYLGKSEALRLSAEVFACHAEFPRLNDVTKICVPRPSTRASIARTVRWSGDQSERRKPWRESPWHDELWTVAWNLKES